ncbi:MAG: RNA polymerase factor sigma-54 [Planctomycetota bacterium]|nr:RNA polymerase factor sigma-54 [Planctomycetota bacterium]
MGSMRFDTSQSMRLGQQMKLSPRMIQSMEILHMALPALQERIEQELESNIALETLEPELDLEDPEIEQVRVELERERREDERSDREGERELVVGQGDEAADFERLDGMERDYGEEFNDHDSPRMHSSGSSSTDGDSKMAAMNNAPSRGESLVDQLLAQWKFVEVGDDLLETGKRLIEYIGDDGLLDADLETIQEQTLAERGIDIPMDLLERSLALVQTELEPAGIAARSVPESLLLQLDGMQGPDDDVEEQLRLDARRLISNHFEDLLENRLPQIQRDSGISLERIQAAKDWMHCLELSPGRLLVDETVRPIIPDVRVEYDAQRDQYVAALADDPILRLRVSPEYSAMAEDSTTDETTREFVGRNVRDASWLIEAISQRKNTLLRVVNVVLTRQREFFDHGPQHLKPLPMVDVAEQLGIHVATVSRAVAEKWMETPRGYFPLRRFFSGGLETEGGKDMSWEAVKEMVREIVSAEDLKHPYSDQVIADMLNERGVKIARRTVVKYREQLGIPSARRRKVHS